MTGPSYGAATLDLTPPNGATHAVQDDRGRLTPQELLDECMRVVPAGGTVVVHQGDWPVSVVPPRGKPFTIQPAPGTRPRLVGYYVAEAQHWRPTDDIGHSWLPWAPMDATPNADEIIDRAHPLAAVPEQVWVDGIPATLVAYPEEPDAGEFAVSPTRLIIGDNPAEHEIRVAVRQTAFMGGPARVDLIGLDVIGYATPSLLRAAVTAFADGTVVSHVRVVECSAAGISARGQHIRLDHVDVVGNGQLGIHGWQAHHLDIGHSIISGNNRDQYSRIGEAGGAKWAGSTDVTARDCLLVENNGHGLWADLRSDRARYLRNEIIGGASAGIHFEGSADGAAYGNRATNCVVGILGSNCGGLDVAHNTATGNDTDIRFQRSEQSDEFPAGGNQRRGNRTSDQVDEPVGPDMPEIHALGLIPPQSIEPQLGWYGPTPTPPEEPPMPEPYDTAPLHEAWDDGAEAIQAVEAEVRRLEALIAADGTRAQLDQCARDLLAEVQAHQVTTSELTFERNRNDELVRLGAFQDAHIAELLQDHADDRLTIADLTQRLADCEADEPGTDPIVVGGSHPNGWPALKTMLGGPPDAFRQFANTPRLTVSALAVVTDVQADGAIPYVSVLKPSAMGDAEEDAEYNAAELIGVGADQHVGVIIPVHEPTQKMTGPEFKAMVTAALPIYRDHLPNWERLLCFMRQDFLDPSLPRWPGLYLPDDLTLIDGIAVDLYDKGNADADGNGKAFGWLMAEVEEFAREHGLVIHVTECSAPDVGQRPGSPPVSNPRRAGWKRDFTLGAWDHITAPTSVLPDGRRLYGSWLSFNGLGPDAPAAVTLPDGTAIPAGWRFDTTPDALQALQQVLDASRGLS